MCARNGALVRQMSGQVARIYPSRCVFCTVFQLGLCGSCKNYPHTLASKLHFIVLYLLLHLTNHYWLYNKLALVLIKVGDC